MRAFDSEVCPPRVDDQNRSKCMQEILILYWVHFRRKRERLSSLGHRLAPRTSLAPHRSAFAAFIVKETMVSSPSRRSLNHVALQVMGGSAGDSQSQEKAQSAQSMCTSGAGTRLVIGTFTGHTTLGGTTMSAAVGDDDIYLLKANAMGAVQWALRLGTAIAGSTEQQAIACDSTHAWVSGWAASGGTGVAKYSIGGALSWSSSVEATVTSLAIDASSTALYLGGFYEGTVNAAGASLTSVGSTDAIVMKLDAANGDEVRGSRHSTEARPVPMPRARPLCALNDIYCTLHCISRLLHCGTVCCLLAACILPTLRVLRALCVLLVL